MTSTLRALALLAVALSLAGLLLLSQATLARADGITVTSAADTDIDDGLCTLREAITNANNNNTSGSTDCLPGGGSADTITFAGDYTITLSSALPNLASELTIDGSGQSVTINGNNSVRGFRLQSGSQVIISHLSIISGLGTVDHGGGILVEAGATLIFTDSTLSGNRAIKGAGLYNQGGQLIISHSNLLNNRAGNGGGGDLYNDGGNVTIDESVLTGVIDYDSPIPGSGGSIYNTGALTLTNSTISSHLAKLFGGGIYNEGTLKISDSTLSSNIAWQSSWDNYPTISSGGGIYNSGGVLTISHSILSSNHAVYGYGGGIYNESGIITMSQSTLWGNSSYSGSSGGIYNDGPLTISNSTLSGNDGGGIYNIGPLTLINSTLSDNEDGGLVNDGILHLSNSLIANSLYRADCYNSGTIATNINNLVEDGGCNSVFSGDPALGPLQDNGGSIPTHALLPGSLALDAGAAAACTPTDQRGITRSQGSGCDIGAFESRGFSLILTGGDNQSTWLKAPFPNPLALTVSSAFSEPIGPGGLIIFTGPSSGASINPVVFTATTDASGAATQVVTANTIIGSYTVTATAAGAAAPLHYNLTNHNLCAPSLTVTSTGGQGPSSLYQALLEICEHGTIDFDSSLISQTLVLSFQLVIDKNVTFTNPHAPGLKISGNNLDWLFNIQAGNTVTVSHLTLSGNSGGGLSNSGSLTLLDSIISDNDGPGLDNAGSLAVNNSNLSDNSGNGLSNSGSLTIADSILSNNSGTGLSNSGTLTVTHSTLSNNGNSGIFNSGTVMLSSSVLSNNVAYYGGGISNEGTLTIISSTLSNNTALWGIASNSSERLAPFGGIGGGIFNNGPLTITHSILLNNSGRFFGGGISNGAYKMTILVSTLSGNASEVGSAIYNHGPLLLRNSTILGHIWNQGSLHFSNSLIANGGGVACSSAANTIVTNLNNLVEDGRCSENGINFRKGDTRLGPLQDNGGPTLTHAPLPGSPLLNAGDNDAAAGLEFDQRGPGFPRILEGVVDIGAVEGVGSNGFLYLPVVRKTFK